MIHMIQSKQYLRKKSTDSWFMSTYQASPYAGCLHDCAYCDGRSEKYYFEGDFGKDLYVRYECPQGFLEDIKKASERGPVLIGSGFTDAYQPSEKTFKLTRQMLVNALPYVKDHALVIITKSDLILRDLDVLRVLQERNRIVVLMSLSTMDDTLSQWVEPGASSASQRLKAIETLKKNDIPVGVCMMPLLPHLSDRGTPLKALLTHIEDLGADFVLPSPLTLRPGKNKDFFMARLQDHQPDLVETYHKLYGESRSSGTPTPDYMMRFREHFSQQIARTRLHTCMPHRIWKDWFPLYETIGLLLNHLTVLYHGDQVALDRLDHQTKRYHAWLDQTKENIGQTKDRYARLTEATEIMLRNQMGLDETFDPRFRQFLMPLLEGKTFDYTTKKWTD